MAMPICPIHRAAMHEGPDGWHICRRDSAHRFRREQGPPPAEEGARHCASNMACPDMTCGGEMEQERPGVWRCTRDPRHVFTVTMAPAPTPAKEMPPAAKRGAAAHRALEEKAGAVTVREERKRLDKPPPFWLTHIGITEPLMPPLQSNAGDGSYCQPLGDIAPGGGSKNRVKKQKKPKKMREDLWGV